MNNALTSSIKYATAELRDMFYQELNDNHLTISGVLNDLIADWLRKRGHTVDPSILQPARTGRPLGSKNFRKAPKEPRQPHYIEPKPELSATPVQSAVATTPKPLGRPKKIPQIPSILDICVEVKTEGWGTYPVGNPRFLTEDELSAIKLQVIDNKLPSQMLDALYTDEIGNYFSKDWEFFVNKCFMSTLKGSPDDVVVNAIKNDQWFPDDPNDPRLPDYERRVLFGENGYLKPGNGKALGMTYKEWEQDVLRNGGNFRS